jgi:hypothetical protein
MTIRKNIQILLINFVKTLHILGLYILWSTSAITISWYIWARFIRERLPRDIPIELSEIGLYIIIYISCIYLYIVISLIWPRNPNKLIVKLVEILFKPLTSLDTAIKSIKSIDKVHRKLLDYLIPILDDLSLQNMKIIYIVMYMCLELY